MDLTCDPFFLPFFLPESSFSFLAVAFAIALLLYLSDDLFTIFQSFDFETALTEERTHLEEPLPYMNVPVTLTYHRTLPYFVLWYMVLLLVAVLFLAFLENASPERLLFVFITVS